MLSYPNNKPPRVETLAAMTSGIRECVELDAGFRLFVSRARGREVSAELLGKFERPLCRQNEAESMRHPGLAVNDGFQLLDLL
jgi:ribosomal protein S12 methylthiotransferase accessory factor YcaO